MRSSRNSRIEREQNRAMRQQARTAYGMEREQVGIGQAAAAALIGTAAVEIAVTHHPGTASQRGHNQALDMIAARCGEQQGFGARVPACSLGAQQKRADGLCPGRAARFTRDLNLDPLRAQGIGEHPRLGRFADTFAAFETDEASTQPVNLALCRNGP
jgi:hypothetical protein